MRARLPLLALALAAVPAAAQSATTPGAPGAEAAVEAYVAAFAAGDLEAAFAKTDPVQAAEFADLMSSLTGGEKPSGESPPKTLARMFEGVLGASSEVGEALGTLDAGVVGTVLEGDSLAHVVVRSSFSLFGGPLDGVQVTTARWDGRRWWITFGPELAAMRRGLEAREAGGLE